MRVSRACTARSSHPHSQIIFKRSSFGALFYSYFSLSRIYMITASIEDLPFLSMSPPCQSDVKHANLLHRVRKQKGATYENRHALEADRDLSLRLWAWHFGFLFSSRPRSCGDRDRHYRCHRLAFSSASEVLSVKFVPSRRSCREDHGVSPAEALKAAFPPIVLRKEGIVHEMGCRYTDTPFFLLTNIKKRSIM